MRKRPEPLAIHTLSDETVAAIDELRNDLVAPVTGFASYGALIASLATERS